MSTALQEVENHFEPIIAKMERKEDELALAKVSLEVEIDRLTRELENMSYDAEELETECLAEYNRNLDEIWALQQRLAFVNGEARQMEWEFVNESNQQAHNIWSLKQQLATVAVNYRQKERLQQMQKSTSETWQKECLQ